MASLRKPLASSSAVAELGGARPLVLMKPKPRFRKAILCGIAFLCFVLYTTTRSNVSWRVHRHYPTAEVSLRAEGNPDPTFFGIVCRDLGMRYFSPSETVGISITGHPTAIDFTHFRGMTVTYLYLKHCVISDIHPLLTMYRPVVSLIGCDLSHLPEEQKRFLHYQPEFDRYSIFIPEDTTPRYPGGLGLDGFYP